EISRRGAVSRKGAKGQRGKQSGVFYRALPTPFLPFLPPFVLRGDATVDRKVGQERYDLSRAERARVMDAVEADGAFDPVDVGLFGAVGEVFDPGELTNLVEELHRLLLQGWSGETRASQRESRTRSEWSRRLASAV